MSKIKTKKKTKSKTLAKKSKLSSGLDCLRHGDLIEVIAPGSSTAQNVLEEGAKALKSWGYRVQFEKDLIDPKIFLSNSDQYRFNSFKKAITNQDSKAVWCLRGGYGSIRLLPFIEKMPTPKHKKLLIGLSDISSLHVIMNQKWKWPTLHGPLIDRIALNKLTPENIYELRQAIENPDYVSVFDNLKPINQAAQKQKTIKSQVVGGNLMVVTSTLGTKWQIDTSNKILFLEELCERAYRVDRCLQQMKQAGLFNKVKAVVFGDFTDCHEPNNDNYIPKVFEEFFRDLKIPAFKGVETGHGEKQRPLFFNTEAHLSGGKKPQMLVYSPFNKF